MNSPSSPGSVDLLVLAAYAPELASMRRLLGDHLYGNVSGVVVACKAVGVGLPNATAGTTLRLMQLRPRAVVLVGTCGLYLNPDATVPGTIHDPQAGAPHAAGQYAIGDGVVARRVQLVDPIEIEQRGAMPEPMSRTIDCNPMIALGLGQGRTPTAEVANTLVLTTDDALGTLVSAGSGCVVENLECFGIANACALQNVPFACVVGIANHVGAKGRDEWRAYHKPAAHAACELVNRWLVAGAMGLPHG